VQTEATGEASVGVDTIECDNGRLVGPDQAVDALFEQVVPTRGVHAEVLRRWEMFDVKTGADRYRHGGRQSEDDRVDILTQFVGYRHHAGHVTQPDAIAGAEKNPGPIRHRAHPTSTSHRPKTRSRRGQYTAGPVVYEHPVRYEQAVTERNDGLRAVLLQAPVYRASQWAIGADSFFRYLANEVIRSTDTSTVVDIGCGTGDVADHIDFASYTGFDPNPPYVERASARLQDRYPHRAQALVGAIGDPDLRERLPREVDVVLAIGVFHHLDDDLVSGALELTTDVLAADGQFIAADPGLVPGQHRLARALVTRDRGQHVRSPEATEALLQPYFPSATIEVRHDLLRVPYTHIIVSADAAC
jgi:SAM-dependent methyltransferase